MAGAMALRAALPVCAAVLTIVGAVPARAQDAAETAQILSGAGPSQGKAARSLGSAVSRSINAAAASVRATRDAGHAMIRRRSRGARHAHVIAPGGNDLEGTDAPTYRLGNGASIRVSGRLVQGAGTMCVRNCRDALAGAAAAPQPAE